VSNGEGIKFLKIIPTVNYSRDVGDF